MYLNRLSKTANEHGRSMTEMLGVLAIIGVLSIGGVMGYSYAMDKYRANEAINALSMIKTDIIKAKRKRNKANPESVAAAITNEWSKEGNLYPVSVFYDEEYGRYGIEMTGIPSSICHIIGDTIPNNIEIRLSVNNEQHEYGTADVCDLNDTNTMFFFLDGRKCVPECPANQECIDGECQYIQFEEGCKSNADCNPGYTGTNCSICTSFGHCQVAMGVEGQLCTFDDGSPGQCNQGTCVLRTQGCTYTTNTCSPGKYCASPNTSTTEAFPSGSTGSCVDPRYDLVTITVNGSSESWYISENTLSYYDAVKFCETLNGQMPSVSDLADNWQSSTSAKRNDRAKALYNKMGEYPALWTNTTTTNDQNITVSYFVDLTTDSSNYISNVGYEEQNEYNYYNAACKK